MSKPQIHLQDPALAPYEAEGVEFFNRVERYRLRHGISSLRKVFKTAFAMYIVWASEERNLVVVIGKAYFGGIIVSPDSQPGLIIKIEYINGAWIATEDPTALTGTIDWQGPPGDGSSKLVWTHGKYRYRTQTSYSADIYYNNALAATAPLSGVLGCALTTYEGVQYMVAVVRLGTLSAYYRTCRVVCKPFNGTFIDNTGWTVMSSDFTVTSPDTDYRNSAWFFNQSGTEAVCLYNVNRAPDWPTSSMSAIKHQTVVKISVNMAALTATITDEGAVVSGVNNLGTSAGTYVFETTNLNPFPTANEDYDSSRTSTVTLNIKALIAVDYIADTLCYLTFEISGTSLTVATLQRHDYSIHPIDHFVYGYDNEYNTTESIKHSVFGVLATTTKTLKETASLDKTYDPTGGTPVFTQDALYSNISSVGTTRVVDIDLRYGIVSFFKENADRSSSASFDGTTIDPADTYDVYATDTKEAFTQKNTTSYSMGVDSTYSDIYIGTTSIPNLWDTMVNAGMNHFWYGLDVRYYRPDYPTGIISSTTSTTNFSPSGSLLTTMTDIRFTNTPTQNEDFGLRAIPPGYFISYIVYRPTVENVRGTVIVPSTSLLDLLNVDTTTSWDILPVGS